MLGYENLLVAITVTYSVWFFPKSITNGFKMVIASDGSHHWVEDDDVPAIISKEAAPDLSKQGHK
jgi:hypothetical protein